MGAKGLTDQTQQFYEDVAAFVIESGINGASNVDIMQRFKCSQKRAEKATAYLCVAGRIKRGPRRCRRNGGLPCFDPRIAEEGAEHCASLDKWRELVSVDVELDIEDTWPSKPFTHAVVSAADAPLPAGLGPRSVFDLGAMA